ncbi:substrate-binding domain-containing protein [Brenneria salicis]|uniref:Substrate-binding family protein n=1 Tax=Brenneria salicis ATCC 15712 = DSM 30166 TaxID=714314 RepID=A0A366IAD8_9GAMM|nr:substrate-binding domain-containing protein [Brenneria salicis]RBP65833.1 substrate-binding family protein [Brenneria salicis ATCC 15712 = DSM 30166]RLM31868.1 hypothetical protein BHG07_03450 [Brenneria salicis ATCC 15712 = DSM 30166]
MGKQANKRNQTNQNRRFGQDITLSPAVHLAEPKICCHGEIAFVVLLECQRRRMKIPYDLALVCLDGSVQCDHTFPALTARWLEYETQGAVVGRLGLAMINGDSPPPAIKTIKLIFEPRASC